MPQVSRGMGENGDPGNVNAAIGKVHEIRPLPRAAGIAQPHIANIDIFGRSIRAELASINSECFQASLKNMLPTSWTFHLFLTTLGLLFTSLPVPRPPIRSTASDLANSCVAGRLYQLWR
ncbi:hypothetical protein [Mesorhizobium sp. LNHC252B00]|uniref:hypothetical protein n=1 Tax=Mesorhizobium sp. LNHC252B00 TaxID=1287252 RepID=UPI0012EBD71A|nr:hypothetical protein [Mesorhizobium sp. LNHC252B00]